jgi:hypothetical protein
MRLIVLEMLGAGGIFAPAQNLGKSINVLRIQQRAR